MLFIALSPTSCWNALATWLPRCHQLGHYPVADFLDTNVTGRHRAVTTVSTLFSLGVWRGWSAEGNTPRPSSWRTTFGWHSRVVCTKQLGTSAFGENTKNKKNSVCSTAGKQTPRTAAAMKFHGIVRRRHIKSRGEKWQHLEFRGPPWQGLLKLNM